MAKYIFNRKPYVSLENPDTRELAQEDPRGFLKKYAKVAVFDEVQRCPHLFSYLQELVDEGQQPGSFVLTGSQQFGLMSGISQSLAGRVALIQLLPFKFHECCSGKRPKKLFILTMYYLKDFTLPFMIENWTLMYGMPIICKLILKEM